jgi:hypothetical protein
MHRAQIILEKWQYDALRSRAECDGRSVSEMVREAVDAYLGRARTVGSGGLAAIRGIGADASATGRTHDRYLYPLPTKRRRR